MKKAKYLITIVLITFSIVSQAQQMQSMEFILNNGNKITGIIISNNIGNITIKTEDGSIFIIDNCLIKSSIAVTSGIRINKELTEQIYLKNGSIICAEIISSSDSNIKIKTSDGMIWEFPNRDVDKVIKITGVKINGIKGSKWGNAVTIGGGVSLDNGIIPQQELKYILSYEVVAKLKVGMGLKSDLYFQSQNTVHLLSPLVSITLSPWKDILLKPILNVDLGYSHYSSFSNHVGVYLNPYFSSVIFKHELLGIGVSLGYKYQNVSLENQALNSFILGICFIF